MVECNEHPIFVTQPFLPPLEEFIPYLEQIWDNKTLTNNGPFHQQLEKELAEYLGVKYISLFANGTLALVTALQALKITGEVITTPFSFVATAHSLWWNNIKPVFVDIEPDYFNIDPEKIEAAITPYTTAIMPVHVYGNPCNVEQIQRIADTYGLKVIYDAAHAFGVKLNGNSILNYGDLSVLSFHATKVYNTFEGGAIISPDEKTKIRIDNLKNFGFVDGNVVAPGINAKMNEIQASFGLLQLQHMREIFVKRAEIAKDYRCSLKNINGIGCLFEMKDVLHNNSYFPIIINSNQFGISRDELFERLKKKNIYCRPYFYPLISNFSTYKHLPSSSKSNLQIANNVADQILCLPIYPDLTKAEFMFIIESIIESSK